MAEHIPLQIPDDPRLAANITYFARALRKAGLPIGPGRIIDAINAVAAAGFTDKFDFFYVLQACFVTRPEHRATFAQIFRLYWRDPRYLEHMMAYMIPAVRGVQEQRSAKAAEKRAAEALLDGVQPEAPDTSDEQGTEIEIDASMTLSAEERLRSLDFEQMSTAEIAAAKRMLARLTLPVKPLQTRRTKADARGTRIDAGKTLRRAMRTGGEMQSLARMRRRTRMPNLVVLCDISGSMSQYSRMVLHFLHAVANDRSGHGGVGWAQVHAFTFGTQLTNITRHLRTRDVDASLAAAGAQAQDWEGGTRIGDCLERFNKDWSRRVLGQDALVVLITDGLDCGAPDALSAQMQRLQLSARKLIWLNPLLRWAEFAPKATGIRAMLPHVDAFRAGHSIASLEDLAQALSDMHDTGEKDRLMRALTEVS